MLIFSVIIIILIILSLLSSNAQQLTKQIVLNLGWPLVLGIAIPIILLISFLVYKLWIIYRNYKLSEIA